MNPVTKIYTPITHFASKAELYKHFMNRRQHDTHYNDTVWLKRGIHHAVGIPIEEAKSIDKRLNTNPFRLPKRPEYEVKVYE